MSKTDPQMGKPSEVVAAEVRGVMAAKRRTCAALGIMLGLSYNSTHRRMIGTVPFSTDELGKVADWLGVPVARLMTQGPAYSS